jgi:hypothetical protein
MAVLLSLLLTLLLTAQLSHCSQHRKAAHSGALRPEQALRVVTQDEDLSWSQEERVRHAAEFSAGLPKHRGLTVVVRRFGVATGVQLSCRR